MVADSESEEFEEAQEEDESELEESEEVLAEALDESEPEFDESDEVLAGSEPVKSDEAKELEALEARKDGANAFEAPGEGESSQVDVTEKRKKITSTDHEKIFEELRKIDQQNRARAQTLITESKKALDGGDFAGAYALAKKVHELDPDKAADAEAIMKASLARQEQED